ncbi:hypothetical protein ATE47_07385 [Chryseobacterium sp. IHB B 17019]|jgi:hypothetical protein|uniref:hypothetical protein n=1 Tax=Chryseobacterium sp. IHB B 17019 TaxID=1721091 RepID=UPI00071F5233|nr:hypothetical protein [Chryseobacterium sp. IHB B 17019]ALR30355.1 hypothetical protein ATE47_07385 [Chryseobacterium sp. IHB B 17019]
MDYCVCSNLVSFAYNTYDYNHNLKYRYKQLKISNNINYIKRIWFEICCNLYMKVKNILSPFLGKRSGKQELSKEVENAAKYLAVGVLALLALGVFTTSQRINAG